MINTEYLLKAQNQLKDKHNEIARVEAERKKEILSKFPEYARLEQELAQTMYDVIAVAMNGGENREKRLNAIKCKNLEIQSKMSEILVKNGFSSDYLKPLYVCPICRDTGSVDGNWCSCIKRAAVKFAADDLNENGLLCRFEDFNLSLYSDENDPQLGCSPREAMKNNFVDCVKFVEKFNGMGSGIFMIGATGLGKTHLSLSIANELIKKGFSVVYNSVPELVRKLNSEQFGKVEGDTMQIINDCDLLILDDLGSEHSTEYSASLVYQLINSRLSRNKPVIASTNLNENEIKNRYQDRIWSRLFSMRVLLFYGTDNRLKTMNKNW